MNVDKEALRSSIGYERLFTVSKVVLAIVSILFIAYLATFLPGTEYVIPQTGIGIRALIGAALAMLLVALLVYVSSAVARLTRMVLDGPPVIIESLASVVRWTVLLAAVVVAHLGLTPLASAIFGGAIWAFDLLFLFIALPVLLIIAFRLYVSLDPAAKYIAESVGGSTDSG